MSPMNEWDSLASAITQTILNAAASLGEASAGDLQEYGTTIGRLTAEAVKRGSMEDLNILRDTGRALLEKQRVRVSRKTSKVVHAVLDGVVAVAQSQIGILAAALTSKLPYSTPQTAAAKEK